LTLPARYSTFTYLWSAWHSHLAWDVNVTSAEAILAMVSQVPWFCAATTPARGETSQAALADYLQSCGNHWPGRWADGWEEAARVVRGLDDTSSFWLSESQWRKHALAAVRASERNELLADMLHRLSIAGYEAVRPQAPSEELARVASGAALWTAAEALTWAVVADLLAPQANPFRPKLRLFELGHWPLGVVRGSIVVM
jgi:hypothetical protein